MTIERTIEILPNRRLEMDLPFELPLGRAKLELTIIPEAEGTIGKTESAFGCLNRFADQSKISGENGAWARTTLKKNVKN